ncbi:MAG: malate/lactate/ureidoglycolate dehydrogenase [Casimicrobium sp.]
MTQKKIPASDLTQRLIPVFIACGLSESEAKQVTENLVLANLSGHDSHGVGMLPRYVDAVLEGGLNPKARLTTKVDSGALLGFDAQRGFGQLMGAQAMARAIERAREQGCCVMALANSHHLGRIGHWAEMAIAANLVSVHFVNVLARPVVAAWGGADGRYGTNPFCVGMPTGFDGKSEPFVLDFATSRVAQGKMRVAHNEGRSVDEGLLIDPSGRPTTDPSVVVVPNNDGRMGALLPFGEHKGYGLAIACELLGGALTGGGTWHRAADNKRAVLNGMLTILIDPKRIGDSSIFVEETRAFIDWIKATPRREGFDDVYLAGEPERIARAARMRDGIEIDITTWKEIVEAAEKMKVSL